MTVTRYNLRAVAYELCMAAAIARPCISYPRRSGVAYFEPSPPSYG
jgi:hypothetical protein